MAIWYVRPNTSHSLTRNGTSYETAWGGWSEVLWGPSNVKGGDTLYICGTHSYSSNVVVGVHNGSDDLTRCTISGSHPQYPGTLTFVGNVFLSLFRPWTTITGITMQAGTSNCIYAQVGSSNCIYSNNNFTSANSRAALQFAGATGQHHANIVVSGNNFTGTGNGMEWLATGTNISSVTNITISGNNFTNLNTSRAAIHFRGEPTVPLETTLVDIVCYNNTFTNIKGKPMEFAAGANVYGSGKGIKVYNNIMNNCSAVAPGSGLGGNSIHGFAESTTPGFGKNIITGNVGNNIVGAAGFFNVFYGSYEIYKNKCNGVSTETIDGNGILVDHGNDKVNIYSNELKNCIGKTGVSNSGCGVMVLDSTNVQVYGNYIERCRVGFWSYTAIDAIQDNINVFNNTFLESTIWGVYIGPYVNRSGNIVKNNIFTGWGVVPFVKDEVGGWTNEDYNCVYGMTASLLHNNGVNNLQVDPMVDYVKYVPNNTSLYASGISVSCEFKDFYGYRFNNKPTVGAVEMKRTAVIRR